MKVVVLFERSGRVRKAFEEKGHYAVSVDIEDTMLPGNHLKMDIRNISYEFLSYYDLMIMFPPCTYFSCYNRYLIKQDPTRIHKRNEDLELIKYLWNAPVPKIAMENPATGSLKHLFQQMTQDIQPYEFGEDYEKRTGLWLKNLPPLLPTEINLNYTRDWTENSSSYIKRILTPYGLAAAMAEQWG